MSIHAVIAIIWNCNCKREGSFQVTTLPRWPSTVYVITYFLLMYHVGFLLFPIS